MHLKESEVLKEKIEELIPKSRNRESMHLVIGLPCIQKIAFFLRKSNKKYKTTADKKRREKFFEEDMMKVYLRRERISAERIPTEQLYPDLNLRVSFFLKRETDIG